MSTIVMSACWPLQMPPTAKAVLVSLADNANDHGVCWPSLTKICERTCFGRTAVIDAVHWLEEQGFISADRENGRRTTYQVTVPSRELFANAKPVRQANQSGKRTGAAGESNQSARRTGPVRQADTNRQEPSGTANSSEQPEAARGSEAFERWWAAYPKKVGKKPCITKWRQKKLDGLADALVADVKNRIANDGRWLDGYIPNPATYLTQERWNDEVQPRRDAQAAAPAPAPQRDWREPSETPLERAINWAHQQRRMGLIDDAERDRLIAEATAKHREAEPA